MELNKIYLGDCYELIKQLPDNSVDLVYTDIPYLIVDGGKGAGFLKNPTRNALYEKTIGKFADGIDMSILDELCRVMKKINIFIWCSQEQIFDIWNFFKNKEQELNIKVACNPLVWCKTNPTPFCNNTWLPDIEYCLYFREQGVKLNDGVELKSRWYMSKTNKADKKDYVHPTIKPLELVERHILHTSKPNDVVLDPFMGSGTTAVASQNTGRNFIGYEIDENYHRIALDRLEGIKANGQLSLFGSGGFKQETLDLDFGEGGNEDAE